MSSAGGNVATSPLWTDVFLDVDPNEAGSACAIAFSQPSRSDVVFECRVLADTPYGRFHVGTFRTVPPTRGSVPSRLVATVCYPGATGWSAQWRMISGNPASNGGDPCRCDLASAPAVGLPPGVTVVPVAGGGPTAIRTQRLSGPAPLASQRIANPGDVVYGVVATMGNANVAAANCWVQLFDSVAAPLAGANPIATLHVGQAAALSPADPSTARFDFGPDGYRVQNGLWLVSSDASAQLVVSGQTLAASVDVAVLS